MVASSCFFSRKILILSLYLISWNYRLKQKKSFVVRLTTTFQGNWFTKCCVIQTKSRGGREEKRGKMRWAECQESGKESLFKGGVFFSSSGFGIFMVCDFFSFNIIIPPHGKPSLVYTWRTAHSNLYPIFPSSSFQLMFLSLFYNFCCFYFLSAAVQPAFDSVFLSVQFFSGRNHSPIFILSSFVCEQRPQKVALVLSLAGVEV